jgi:hypothetical protein
MANATRKPFTASTSIVLSSGSVFDGFSRMRSKSPGWPKLVLFTAAMAAVLFVATGASFLHQDAPGTICSICYAAHLPALRSIPVRTPLASYAITWWVPAELLLNHAAPEALSSAPRAPPA